MKFQVLSIHFYLTFLFCEGKNYKKGPKRGSLFFFLSLRWLIVNNPLVQGEKEGKAFLYSDQHRIWTTLSGLTLSLPLFLSPLSLIFSSLSFLKERFSNSPSFSLSLSIVSLSSHIVKVKDASSSSSPFVCVSNFFSFLFLLECPSYSVDDRFPVDNEIRGHSVQRSSFNMLQNMPLLVLCRTQLGLTIVDELGN